MNLANYGNFDAWKTRYPSFDLDPVSITAIDSDGGETVLMPEDEVNGADVAPVVKTAWTDSQAVALRVHQGRIDSEDFRLADYAYGSDLAADVADYIDNYEYDDDYYED